MTMQYTLVGSEDGSSNITVFVAGRAPLVAHSSHPNFAKIKEGLFAGDESIIDLFDIAQTAATNFQRLTERVTTANGRLYFDGDEVDNSLATQIVRFLSEDVDDWKPLVNFFENVQQNPNDHSREQLYGWLDKRAFTITPDGLVVGYKSVNKTGKGFESIQSGRAIVDGDVVNGIVPIKVGSIVEMPRGEVQHDPSVGCSTGLHVGTYEYAARFSGDTVLEVHVNPRDVVSVPTDSNEQKMRVCRYVVVEPIHTPHTVPVRKYDPDNFDLDAFEEEWGICSGCNCLFEDCDCGESPLDKNIVEPSNETKVATPTPPKVARNLLGKVKKGDVFKDTDSRRKGRQFKVERVEGDFAIGKSLPSNLTRTVRVDRLLSRKYRKV